MQRQKRNRGPRQSNSGGCCWAGGGGSQSHFRPVYLPLRARPPSTSLWGVHLGLLLEVPTFCSYHPNHTSWIPELSSPSSRFSQIFRARGASMPQTHSRHQQGAPPQGSPHPRLCGASHLPPSSTLEPVGGCGRQTPPVTKCPLHPHPRELGPPHGSVR